ncbi:MAG: hypothetical protein WKF76_08235 [Nocardioidaceae bacterium]
MTAPGRTAAAARRRDGAGGVSPGCRRGACPVAGLTDRHPGAGERSGPATEGELQRRPGSAHPGSASPGSSCWPRSVHGGPRAAATGGRIVRYAVRVSTAWPYPRTFAAQVDAILADVRGWGAVEGVRLVFGKAGADLTVVLASPRTTDRLCALPWTCGKVSCWNGGRAIS